jgi:hypothetical protein
MARQPPLVTSPMSADRVSAETSSVRPFRLPARVLKALWIVVAAYGLLTVLDVTLHPTQYQWDFRSYYFAGRAYVQELNPYSLDDLARVAGRELGYPYAYPPITLPLLGWASGLEFSGAYLLFLGLKVVALGALVYLWSMEFLGERPDPAFVLFCFFGFGGALYTDLVAGNVTVFEQLALWMGLAALRRGRAGLFCVLVLLASSFKLLPVFFLALLPILGFPRWYRYLAASIGAFLAAHAVSFLLQPGLFRSFLSVAQHLDERGAINPSSLALVRDVFEAGARKGLVLVPDGTAEAIYFLLAVGFLSVAIWAARRQEAADSRDVLYLVCLAFALIVPRFKDYAFVLLLVPAYDLVTRRLRSRGSAVLLALLVLAPRLPLPFGMGAVVGRFLWGYYPWVLALGLYVATARTLLRERGVRRSIPEKVGEPGSGAMGERGET